MEEERKKPQAFSKQLQAQTLAPSSKLQPKSQMKKRKREERKKKDLRRT